MSERTTQQPGYPHFLGPREDPIWLPVAMDDRLYLGDLNIRVRSDGSWEYNDTKITRPELVGLFASMLMVDCQGSHWLVSSTEMGRIKVDDAPFIAVELFISEKLESQNLSFRTNIDEIVSLGEFSPIYLKTNPHTHEAKPYVMLDRGLEALLSRSVYYQLCELCVEMKTDKQTVLGVWSGRYFFPLSYPMAIQPPLPINGHSYMRQ
ncbi:MAG: DUF1285 domain-containing protein [Rhodospirillaceae bacterium]|nr:DUF1285 domain-containing protein [Rhodospirillaceae bacterium]